MVNLTEHADLVQIASTTTPGRVYLGKRMAGHMGK